MRSTVKCFIVSSFSLNDKSNYRQRWQAPNVPAELAKRVICACIRQICFFRDFMGSKDKDFLGHFLLGIFIQDNLPVNLKQEVWPISQLRSGTERKKTTGSLDRSSTSSNMQAAMQGQAVLKVHGNLNKGVSGSMKLNR